MNDTQYARFMRLIEVGVKPEDCWLWTGLLEAGYGQFWINDRLVKAHKLMLEHTLGRSLREGMNTRHTCKNKHCCNPDHLEEVAYKLLTPDNVRAIRSDTRPQYIIAEEYNVTSPSISQIQRRITWRHVLDD